MKTIVTIAGIEFIDILEVLENLEALDILEHLNILEKIVIQGTNKIAEAMTSAILEVS